MSDQLLCAFLCRVLGWIPVTVKEAKLGSQEENMQKGQVLVIDTKDSFPLRNNEQRLLSELSQPELADGLRHYAQKLCRKDTDVYVKTHC